MSLTSCSECRTNLSPDAETCPECGYPVSAGMQELLDDHVESSRSTLKEYKRIQLLGAFVTSAGIVAAMVDSPIAATVAVTVGIGTYVTGLLGAWWNSGD